MDYSTPEVDHAESDEQVKDNKSSIITMTLWILFALSLTYVLSLGPFAGLMFQGILPNESINIFDFIYYPLFKVADNVPILKRLMHWYIVIWCQFIGWFI
jgi:hypothetical protein